MLRLCYTYIKDRPEGQHFQIVTSIIKGVADNGYETHRINSNFFIAFIVNILITNI